MGGGGVEIPLNVSSERLPKSSSGLLISAWITDIQIMCPVFKQVPLRGGGGAGAGGWGGGGRGWWRKLPSGALSCKLCEFTAA